MRSARRTTKGLRAVRSRRTLLLPPVVKKLLDLGANKLAKPLRVAVPNAGLRDKRTMVGVELLEIDFLSVLVVFVEPPQHRQARRLGLEELPAIPALHGVIVVRVELASQQLDENQGSPQSGGEHTLVVVEFVKPLAGPHDFPVKGLAERT